MEKDLRKHISFIEDTLRKESDGFDWDTLKDYNRTHIGFFKHERLVHLLITFFFGLMFFLSVVADLLLIINNNLQLSSGIGLLVVSIVLLIMLVFYVLHYFVLENGIQKLYRLDGEIVKRSGKIGSPE